MKTTAYLTSIIMERLKIIPQPGQIIKVYSSKGIAKAYRFGKVLSVDTNYIGDEIIYLTEVYAEYSLKEIDFFLDCKRCEFV